MSSFKIPHSGSLDPVGNNNQIMETTKLRPLKTWGQGAVFPPALHFLPAPLTVVSIELIKSMVHFVAILPNAFALVPPRQKHFESPETVNN